VEFAGGSIKIGLVIAVFASIMQLVTGHGSASTVAVTQPAKLAAFEGIIRPMLPQGCICSDGSMNRRRRRPDCRSPAC